MKKDDMPKKVKPKSRTQLWKEANRERYNEYQRNYMRRYRKVHVTKPKVTEDAQTQD